MGLHIGDKAIGTAVSDLTGQGLVTKRVSKKT